MGQRYFLQAVKTEANSMSDPNSQPTNPLLLTQLTQMIVGYRPTQAIYVAAKLGIADLVAETPRTADELAEATKSHAPSLRRLLLMLSSLGIFAEGAGGKFRATALGELLRRDHPQSQRSLAMMHGSAFFWKPWGALCEAIVTGPPAFNRVFGASLFDYLSTHPEDAAIFNEAMTSISARDIPTILAAYDFSRFERVVDVGGGHGALLHAILSANPELRGVLADRSPVLADATAIRSEAMARRCSVVETNFFDSVPDGADAYLMKHIVHDWSDEDVLKILRNCRRAIQPDGRLLLIEAVLKGANEPDPGKGLDLIMLVLLQGRERTEAEFGALLRDAGFSLMRVIPTSGLMSIIESRPA
jgi:SAM-dependent methyltransferase